jgi:hypothetical protein
MTQGCFEFLGEDAIRQILKMRYIALNSKDCISKPLPAMLEKQTPLGLRRARMLVRKLSVRWACISIHAL